MNSFSQALAFAVFIFVIWFFVSPKSLGDSARQTIDAFNRPAQQYIENIR